MYLWLVILRLYSVVQFLLKNIVFVIIWPPLIIKQIIRLTRENQFKIFFKRFQNVIGGLVSPVLN